jgi:hypothetical protein
MMIELSRTIGKFVEAYQIIDVKALRRQQLAAFALDLKMRFGFSIAEVKRMVRKLDEEYEQERYERKLNLWAKNVLRYRV